MKKSEERCMVVFNFIKSYISEHGYSPSVREIAAAAKLKSPSSAYFYIQRLEEMGYLSHRSNKNRTISLNEEYTAKSVELPIVGNVAAGSPILAEQNISGYANVPFEIAQNGSFLLTISGDSMIKAGILNGDKVIVNRDNNAKDGEIIVALIDESATVKRFFSEDDSIILKPENDEYSPMKFKKEEVNIIGKVIGLYRKIN